MAEHWAARSDRGAVLVLATLLLTGLMVMAAIVVDIGHMRNMRRSNQSTVDLAALAAGDALAGQEGPDAPGACADAVRYLQLNTEGLATLNMACDTLPNVCQDFTNPVVVTSTTDDSAYDVTITFPVTDDLISDPTVGGARENDGERCERMMVEIEHRVPSFFGGIVGRDELTARARAVIRQIPEKADQIPSLWLLDPYGCDVLSVQGGAQVTAGIPNFGGLISLDSNGMGTQNGTGCSGNSFTVDVGGSGSLLEAFPTDVFPPGKITLFAMWPGQQGCADPTGNPYACDPADVSNNTLRPEPTRRPRRATRAPVDHRFNCRTDYTLLTGYPDYHGIPIDQCEGGSGDYIDQLVRTIGTSGTPAGFSTVSGAGCSPSGVVAHSGDVFVDCATFSVGNGTHVEFTGGNVVFKGSISVSNGGSISFNTNNPTQNLLPTCEAVVVGCIGESSAESAWVYQRSGNVSMQGGEFRANRTTFYQHDGYFRMTGGLPIWSAPTQGPFTSLAYWSEKSSSRYQITGGAAMELTGIFFLPEADPFTLNGGSPLLPQQAQFISYRAAIAGGAVLTLAPLEIDPVVIPPPAPLLIR